MVILFLYFICSASDLGLALLAGAWLDLLLASDYNAAPDMGWQIRFFELPQSVR